MPSGQSTAIPLAVPTGSTIGAAQITIPATASVPAGTTVQATVAYGGIASGLPTTFAEARNVLGLRYATLTGQTCSRPPR